MAIGLVQCQPTLSLTPRGWSPMTPGDPKNTQIPPKKYFLSPFVYDQDPIVLPQNLLKIFTKTNLSALVLRILNPQGWFIHL